MALEVQKRAVRNVANFLQLDLVERIPARSEFCDGVRLQVKRGPLVPIGAIRRQHVVHSVAPSPLRATVWLHRSTPPPRPSPPSENLIPQKATSWCR